MFACCRFSVGHRQRLGLAVVSPESTTLTKFYAHPYSFSRRDPNHPLRRGIETANFLKKLAWSDGAPASISAEYLEDLQIIHVRSGAGEGFFFMPFGLAQTSLAEYVVPCRSQHCA